MPTIGSEALLEDCLETDCTSRVCSNKVERSEDLPSKGSLQVGFFANASVYSSNENHYSLYIQRHR